MLDMIKVLFWCFSCVFIKFCSFI